MEELEKILGNEALANAAVRFLKMSFSVIMKTNCYDIKTQDDGCNSCFDVPGVYEGMKISINCHLNTLNYILISLVAPSGETNFTFIIDFFPGGKRNMQLNNRIVKNFSWIKMDPIERHCTQLIKDLDLSPCNHTQEF